MDLAKGTQDIIRTDSHAAIKTEGLLGDKYIEISFGTNDAEQVKDGQTIGSEPPLDVSDLVAKANLITDKTDGALVNIQGTAEHLNAITANQSRARVGWSLRKR
jgi:ABC-type transporter Mla subunit MlaD